jgi:hypothetical protein
MSVWAPELWPRRSPYDRQRVHDDAIRAARGVDPAIIADQLGVTETFVRRRQRKLGLRNCRSTPGKAEQHE